MSYFKVITPFCFIIDLFRIFHFLLWCLKFFYRISYSYYSPASYHRHCLISSLPIFSLHSIHYYYLYFDTTFFISLLLFLVLSSLIILLFALLSNPNKTLQRVFILLWSRFVSYNNHNNKKNYLNKNNFYNYGKNNNKGYFEQIIIISVMDAFHLFSEFRLVMMMMFMMMTMVMMMMTMMMMMVMMMIMMMTMMMMMMMMMMMVMMMILHGFSIFINLNFISF